jgi:hypothetical protein
MAEHTDQGIACFSDVQFCGIFYVREAVFLYPVGIFFVFEL